MRVNLQAQGLWHALEPEEGETIETLLDVNDLTVEEVTGRLRNVEQRKKNTTVEEVTGKTT